MGAARLAWGRQCPPPLGRPCHFGSGHGRPSRGHMGRKGPGAAQWQGNQPAAGASLTEIKGAFNQRLQLLRSLLLQCLISTAERNNKLNPGFGWERLGPPRTFLLTEIE